MRGIKEKEGKVKQNRMNGVEWGRKYNHMRPNEEKERVDEEKEKTKDVSKEKEMR